MEHVKLSPTPLRSKACSHVGQAKDEVTYASLECPECVAKGGSWVKLRICMVCGHMGCCDSSKNKHAHAHYEKTGHPIIRTIEPGEDWAWCYVDDTYLK